MSGLTTLAFLLGNALNVTAASWHVGGGVLIAALLLYAGVRWWDRRSARHVEGTPSEQSIAASSPYRAPWWEVNASAQQDAAHTALLGGMRTLLMGLAGLAFGILWSQGYGIWMSKGPALDHDVRAVYVIAHVEGVRGRYGKAGAQVTLTIEEAYPSYGTATGSQPDTSASDMSYLEGLRVKVFWGGDVTLWDGMQRVRVRVNLSPLPWPRVPGGYDWGRSLHFEGIDAIGFVTTRPERIEAPTGVNGWVDALRRTWIERSQSYLSPEVSGIAQALLIGRRSGIDQEAIASFRSAGLAHLFAISGLHIGWVSVLFFAISRRWFVAIPTLAERFPVRKWAAVVGMMATLAYAAVAEASVATERATVMAMAAYVAILLNRRVLSTHTVYLAAWMAALVNPASVVTAGFQLSFVAAFALVWAFSRGSLGDYIRRVTQRWHVRAPIFRPAVPGRNRTDRLPASSRSAGGREPSPAIVLYRDVRAWTDEYGALLARFTLSRVATWLVSVVLTMGAVNLISGIATSPFVAWHFGTAQMYGLAGNAVAIPVVLGWIMPALVLFAISPSETVTQWAGGVAEAGIVVVRDWSMRVASWPHAEVPIAPNQVLTVFWLGMLMALLVVGTRWLLRRANVSEREQHSQSNGAGASQAERTTTMGCAVLIVGVVALIGQHTGAFASLERVADRDQAPTVRWSMTPTHVPSIIVGSHHRLVWVLAQDGQWWALRDGASRLEKTLVEDLGWTPPRALSEADHAVLPPVRCDHGGCVVVLHDGQRAGWVRRGEDLADTCRNVDIVILSAYLTREEGKQRVPPWCRAVTMITLQESRGRGTLFYFSPVHSDVDGRVAEAPTVSGDLWLGSADRSQRWR